MGQINTPQYVSGDVVFVPFDYSDLSQSKVRPVVIIKALANNDFLVAMITSKGLCDPYIYALDMNNQRRAGLPRESVIRYSRLFVVNETRIRNKTGRVPDELLTSLKEKIADFIKK
ncbi:type II toxin-antitoxin system PemK/MazF family toxin [Desulfovibrio litoralis]|uniref:mRNA interferase MazF n=1 Tax=Desulfovibrio litoralis DSM 11393 TaxID=1121455 RepID=A0A1M7T8Y8_9BACT|nr:type II toxin-antitoxin system PemK/MazF family toxin [Desulfovibrio litoralis]SHN67199.1 mRNA interferase MazF [Desulfovibrio litoralis DSM 11393]